jgi:hypothetical protein
MQYYTNSIINLKIIKKFIFRYFLQKNAVTNRLRHLQIIEKSYFRGGFY